MQAAAASTGGGSRAYSAAWVQIPAGDQPPAALASLAAPSSDALGQPPAAAAAVDTASSADTETWRTMGLASLGRSWHQFRRPATSGGPTATATSGERWSWNQIGGGTDYYSVASEFGAANNGCASLPDIAILPSPAGSTTGEQY